MIIPDVNLLIYAYNTDAPHHSTASQWWGGAMSGCQDVGIPWVVAMGFLRLMTNGKVMKRPLTAAEALAHIRSWLERPQARVITPGPRHLSILDSFADQQLLTSPLTTDAHIAALAIEFEAELHSNDLDFARFPGLRRHNPLAGRLPVLK